MMSIVLDGTTGVTAPAFDGTLDATDLTGDVAAARITTALNASGAAPIFACRAWVNFDGTGTVAIRASGNVSSITDNGTGDYTVNFTTAMPDVNYAVAFGAFARRSTNVADAIAIANNGANPTDGTPALKTTTQLRVRTGRSDVSVFTDHSECNVIIFR